MKLITSKDGTPIASWQSGSGDPLLLVHGTTSNHSAWDPVLTELEQYFCIWTIDRRGRGSSGDNSNYGFARECEDVATVIDTIGSNVNLLGHSFGGLCALEATFLTSNIGKLILYEPPISLLNSGWSKSLETSMQGLFESRKWEEILLLFFREVLKTPPRELAIMQAASNWHGRVIAAHTILRELKSIDNYIFDSQRFSCLETPIMLMLGSNSPSRRYQTTKTLHQALPNSHIQILTGQQHSAMRSAPDLFVHEVLKFLKFDLLN